MKARIQSTTAIVEMKDPQGRPYTCRVWEGVSTHGVAFTAYIGVVQVKREDDNAEFVRELLESTPPQSDTLRAMDLRFFID